MDQFWGISAAIEAQQRERRFVADRSFAARVELGARSGSDAARGRAWLRLVRIPARCRVARSSRMTRTSLPVIE
jgi:hypothetical protein